MDTNDSVGKFMGGLFFGTFISALIMLLLGYAGTVIAALARLHSFEQLLLSGVIATAILITRPLLLKTVWSDRRDPFLLDQDVTAIIQGRSVGIIFGIIVAIVIENFVFG